MLKDIDQSGDHKNKHEKVDHAVNDTFIPREKLILTAEISEKMVGT